MQCQELVWKPNTGSKRKNTVAIREGFMPIVGIVPEFCRSTAAEKGRA
jgi:hypothetical protein